MKCQKTLQLAKGEYTGEKGSSAEGELQTGVTEVCYWNYVLCMVLKESQACNEDYALGKIYVHNSHDI